jgi:hypothetical protein
MMVKLSEEQTRVLAGALAGFLETTQDMETLRRSQPKAIALSFAQAMSEIPELWREMGWPQKSIVQIAAERGVTLLTEKLRRELQQGGIR